MFDVGFTELMVVAVMGLVILGPERLPVAARTVGKWVGKAKRMVSGVQREIEEELRLDEIKRKAQSSSQEVEARLEELRLETEMMEKAENGELEITSTNSQMSSKPITTNIDANETLSVPVDSPEQDNTIRPNKS